MKILKRLFGIDQLLIKQEETNKHLKLIEQNTRELVELRRKYNKAYHIK